MSKQRHLPWAGKFPRDMRASVMPLFVICLAAIVALIGATIALSMDSSASNKVQQSADASALGGATAFLRSTKIKLDDRIQDSVDQATAIATSAEELMIADVKVLAKSEDSYGQKVRLSVDLSFDPANPAGALVGRNANVDVKSRAVAEAVWGFPLCVLTLAEDGPGLSVNSASDLTAENCVIWSNSTASDSMRFTGGVAEARNFCAAGRVLNQGADVTPTPAENCKTLPDPLEGYNPSSSTACDYIKFKETRNSTARIKPGTYCGGIDVLAPDVQFEPGVYHIVGGDVRFHIKGDIALEGVTFLLDGDLSGFEIKSDSSVTIVAPETGPTAGIVIAQLPSMVTPAAKKIGKAAKPLEASIRGGLTVEGVIYMPAFDLTLSKSGGGETKSPYLQMVVNRLLMDGAATLKIDFNESETSLPIVIKPERYARLIE